MADITNCFGFLLDKEYKHQDNIIDRIWNKLDNNGANTSGDMEVVVNKHITKSQMGEDIIKDLEKSIKKHKKSLKEI